MSRTLLTPGEIEASVATLAAGWEGDQTSLRRTLNFRSFPDAVTFIDRMAIVAERMQHHPDLTLSWRTVGLSLSSHSAGGVTALDTELAAELDGIAATLID